VTPLSNLQDYNYDEDGNFFEYAEANWARKSGFVKFTNNWSSEYNNLPTLIQELRQTHQILVDKEYPSDKPIGFS
jgi:hypothetical protein